MKLLTQAFGGVLLIAALYVGGSFFFQYRVKNAVEELIHQHVDQDLEVKEVTLDGNYLFDKRQSGVAEVSIGGKTHNLEVIVRGNGLWNNARVEIPPRSLLVLTSLNFIDKLSRGR